MTHAAMDLIRTIAYVVLVVVIIRVAIAPKKDGESS